jgi:hypothetical protein
MDPKTIILFAFSLARLAVAIPLFMTARRNRLTNLYWLSAEFLALVIAVPFSAAGSLNNPWIFWTFISITEISLIMFIHTTFYQGRRSPMPIFMVVAVAGLLGGLYGNATGNFVLSAWSVYPIAALVWGWHIVVAYQAFNQVARERATEDWVKSRYKLMIAYAIFDFLSAVGGTLITTGLVINNSGALIVLIINFVGVTLQFLAWVMPEGYRRWLNRNQQVHASARAGIEAIVVLGAVNAAMSDNTGLTPLLCGFAVRSVIGKQLHSEDGPTIDQHISSMGYLDWSGLLDQHDLYELLISKSDRTANIPKAIDNAKRTLIDKQSVFTLMAK